MENLEGKIQLELNIVGDGRIFLNFWNTLTGEDVNAEFEDNKLMLQNIPNPEYDKLEKPLENDYLEKEITISEFIELVQKSYFGLR